MIKLVVMQAGQPEREVESPGDSVTIGRLATCDIVVDEPYVSKQHARILRGLVVVDLGSSNGTFLSGTKLTEPTLLEGGDTLTIGKEGVLVRVVAGPGTETARVSDAESELETLRSRYTLLELEAAKLRRELSQARDTGERDAELGRLRGENHSLKERLESVKKTLEERESEDGGSVQARLAMERMQDAQALSEKLQREVDALKARVEVQDRELGQVAEAAAAQAPDAARAEFDRALAAREAEIAKLREGLQRAEQSARAQREQTETIRSLRKELEELREKAGLARPEVDELLALCQAEKSELEAKVAELEGRVASAAPVPGQQVSDLFFKLQSENNELRRRLVELEKKGPRKAGAAGESLSRQVKELMEARLKIATLESELARARGASAPPAKPVPAVAARPAAAASAGVAAVLQRVVDQDVEGERPILKGAADEFLVLEALRFLRRVERVVTRMAGGFVQLFQAHTMLPGMEGNFRALTGQILLDPSDQGPRGELVEYLEALGRWLVASLGAHRKAAVRFAQKLKDDLSERALLAQAPVPVGKRVLAQTRSVLWLRACDYLAALSPDTIDERLEKLAREMAQEILAGESGRA